MDSGHVFTHPAAARGRFRELMRMPDAELDLGEASLVIALEEYPRISVQRYLERMDQWGEAVRDRAEGSRDAERLIAGVTHLLFEEEGFHGEGDDYYDPRKSFLNEVLDRHEGLPLALSILFIGVSRRAGLSAAGVSLPGRFLVRVSGPGGELLIDPFDAGRILTTAECQQIMDQVLGGAVRLREDHLRPQSNREILGRALAHLKASHLAHQNLQGAIAAIERLLILDENDAWELRDLGMLAMQLHRYPDAIPALERYLALRPAAEDRLSIEGQIAWIRAWLDAN